MGNNWQELLSRELGGRLLDMTLNMIHITNTQKYILLILAIVLTAPIKANALDAERIIRDNSTGGDCTLIGLWDQNTKTCTLTTNLNGPLRIVSSGLSLDGNGHSVSSNNMGVGISGINVSSGITVKNITVTGFSAGIRLQSNNIVENSEIIANNYGIYLINQANNNTLRNNHISKGFYGVYSSNSNGNVIENNIFDQVASYNLNLQFSNNFIIKGNTFFKGFNTVQLNQVNGTKIYNNDFFSSTSNPFIIFGGTNNAFDSPHTS